MLQLHSQDHSNFLKLLNIVQGLIYLQNNLNNNYLYDFNKQEGRSKQLITILRAYVQAVLIHNYWFIYDVRCTRQTLKPKNFIKARKVMFNNKSILLAAIFIPVLFFLIGCERKKVPETIISVDLTKKPDEQPFPLHNRWHPDIPAVAFVQPGDTFRIECLDWTGGQIKNNDDATDVLNVDLNQVHYLSGPVAVRGAEPGDLLVVDIIDIGPLPGNEWGYTCIFAKENGGSFLTDHFPNAAKAVWDFDGRYTTSRHIPGVRFAGIAHPGVIGLAPSRELLDRWNKREVALFTTNPQRIPPLVCPPDPKGAVVGKLKGADAERVMKEGARTVPPRENGGNGDINSLTRGTRIYFPVNVKDALLSVGDLHFSEGDGEISFCGAIEMAGWIELKVDLIKKGAEKYNLQQPIFKSAEPAEPKYSKFLEFEGFSVDEQDKQYYMDVGVSFRRACLNAIDYLKKFGYTGDQICILLSAAPVEASIKAIVDIPNACTTLAIPTEIFNFDICPSAQGPIVQSVKKDIVVKK